METASRRTDAALESRLFQESYRFEFFQAVRWLERLYPERRRVGNTDDPGQEVVHFHARHSLSFPPSEIYEITTAARSGERAEKKIAPLKMTVNFMGLTGPMGVLPRHYTELLMERPGHEALRDFLDIFNHRLISLFYLAWQKFQPAVAFEKVALAAPDWQELALASDPIANETPTAKRESDLFARILFSLLGLGTAGLRGRLQEIDDEAFLAYSGLIARRPLSASALEGVLQDYFETPIKVEQFQGRWLSREDGDGTYLGEEGGGNLLGVNTALGDCLWDQQTKFKLKVGPIPLDKLFDFLPTGKAYHGLGHMTRFLIGESQDFDIQVILQTNEIPPWQLGGPLGKEAPRLGWCTWLAK